jgi:stage III sporulation protein AF
VAALGEYIVSVSATALICGIISGFLRDRTGGKSVKLVCNLLLMLAVLRPIVNLEKEYLSNISLPTFPDGSAWIEEAGYDYGNAVTNIIKQQTEAYILDKAAAMGAAISVAVTVSGDEPPVPVGVEISGSVSPYLKLRLEEMIQEDLNIAKENQVWTG